MSGEAPFRVMTVCTGNICRSPMAEAVLRDRLEAAGLGEAVVVDSTGVSSEESGNPIDPRAVRALRDAGYDVPDHRARRITRAEIAGQDLLLPMTARHAQLLRADAPRDASNIRMLRTFDAAVPTGMADSAELDIADPWYGDQSDFAAALAEIEAAADGVVDFIRRAIAGSRASG